MVVLFVPVENDRLHFARVKDVVFQNIRKLSLAHTGICRIYTWMLCDVFVHWIPSTRAIPEPTTMLGWINETPLCRSIY
jgi:hypothetical protein